jgi:NADH-quinone oxidoreductase subunit I
VTATVVKVHRPEPTLAERLYLKELLRGLWTTNWHFLRNLFRRRSLPTLAYPEAKRAYSPRWRGLHRLMKRDDGSVRCVACMMCATHCPARCITIVAGEHPDPAIEKAPLSFEIDLLKCIWCGLCEEACPCDAIRLDTGLHAPPVGSRHEAVAAMDHLLARGGAGDGGI